MRSGLFTVGAVNRDRIETFKRTSAYTKADYELLVRVAGRFEPLYTVAHVLAEVSNLADLPGQERSHARSVLKRTISLLAEREMPSVQAAEDPRVRDIEVETNEAPIPSRDRKGAVRKSDVKARRRRIVPWACPAHRLRTEAHA